MQSRKIQILWRFAALFLGITALTINLINASLNGNVYLQVFYFTFQTNLFVTVNFAVLLIKTAHQIKKEGIIGKAASNNHCYETAVTLYIFITFLVFWFVVAPMVVMGKNLEIRLTPLYFVNNFLIHALMPFMSVVDWVMLCPHGGLNKKCAFKWLTYPVLYGAILLLRALLCGTFKILSDGTKLYYPYPFLEPVFISKLKICQNGLSPYVVLVFVYISLFVFFYVFGRFTISLDNVLAKEESLLNKNSVKKCR